MKSILGLRVNLQYILGLENLTSFWDSCITCLQYRHPKWPNLGQPWLVGLIGGAERWLTMPVREKAFVCCLEKNLKFKICFQTL
uniref:SMG1 nonsense mediated mRNA decay associated PI3K related kinase n=1 Tax=Pipistrellus kuhlii TaxID=59472 RepID=A0A7J7YZ17_PIPKU|nr:SMG1 nonsense mediated mRNA decay associated PI3K related kinase [Pipistrellus kuhlii]